MFLSGNRETINSFGDNNNIKTNKFPENLFKNGFECKEGSMSSKIKNYMDKIDLIG